MLDRAPSCVCGLRRVLTHGTGVSFRVRVREYAAIAAVKDVLALSLDATHNSHQYCHKYDFWFSLTNMTDQPR